MRHSSRMCVAALSSETCSRLPASCDSGGTVYWPRVLRPRSGAVDAAPRRAHSLACLVPQQPRLPAVPVEFGLQLALCVLEAAPGVLRPSLPPGPEARQVVLEAVHRVVVRLARIVLAP